MEFWRLNFINGGWPGIKTVYGLHVLETDCTLVGISCRLRVVLETLVYRWLELTSQSVMHCSMMGNLPFPTGYYSGNTEIDGQPQVCTRNVGKRGLACQFGTLNHSDILYNNVEMYIWIYAVLICISFLDSEVAQGKRTTCCDKFEYLPVKVK